MTFNFKEELERRNIEFKLLSQEEAHTLSERWRTQFLSSFKMERNTYLWECFSSKHYPCLEGASALTAYLGQWVAPFCVFDESLSFAALCSASAYPDFSDLHRDIYVAHHHMKWTAAFTHEQPYLGPFFALRSASV